MMWGNGKSGSVAHSSNSLYRRKAMYGRNRKGVGQIWRRICVMNEVALLEGKVCLDHAKGVDVQVCVNAERQERTYVFFISIRN